MRRRNSRTADVQLLRAQEKLKSNAATRSENVRLHGNLVKDTLHWEVERGSRLTSADVARAFSLRSAAWDRMRAFQQKYEYFIAPTCQVAPYDLSKPYPTEIAGKRCPLTLSGRSPAS
jgi:hypothetical protein